MPVTYPDYAYSRLERFWVTNEPVFNVGVAPIATDAVVILPGANVPMVAPEYVPSEERNQTPGIRSTFMRKKKPSAFTLPMYLRLPPAAGTVPSWGLMAKKAFGTEAIAAGTSVTYTPATFIEESTFSLWQWMGNEMRHLRGCLINDVTVTLSGTTEGRISFAGLAGNESFAGVSKLSQAAAISGNIFVSDARSFMAFGATSGDTVGIRVEDEGMTLLRVVDYATGELEVTRAAFGTTAATHPLDAVVGPYEPGPDTKPAELVSSCMLGTVTIGGTPIRCIDVEVVLANALEARLDEYGEPVLTGYRRTGPRRITGTFRTYTRQAHQALDSTLERNVEQNMVVTARGTGTAATEAIMTLTMIRTKIDSVAPASDGPEFVKTYAFSALETNGNDELTLAVT
jgi:hypothetical protein